MNKLRHTIWTLLAAALLFCGYLASPAHASSRNADWRKARCLAGTDGGYNPRWYEVDHVEGKWWGWVRIEDHYFVQAGYYDPNVHYNGPDGYEWQDPNPMFHKNGICVTTTTDTPRYLPGKLYDDIYHDGCTQLPASPSEFPTQGYIGPDDIVEPVASGASGHALGGGA